MRFQDHPLYQDPAVTKAATEHHLARGRTIFQLFQFPGGEFEHAKLVHEVAALPPQANILSLGSGVGGMEAHWRELQPDIAGIELVNLSQAQLDLTPNGIGLKVCADAEGYVSPHAPFDAVVLAYMLGHVDPVATLRSAWRNLKEGGKLIVLDVFDSSDAFNLMLQYASPRVQQFSQFLCDMHAGETLLVGGLEPCEAARKEVPADILNQTHPMCVIVTKE